MLQFGFHNVRTLLCLGAHSDDIEIGCGGTILRLVRENPQVKVHWVVFSSQGPRRAEASLSANLFLKGAAHRKVVIHDFQDRYFPTQWGDIKKCFDELGKTVSPDLVFTHRRDDAHQDHRVVAELTWCTFRDHCVLEYEIPKYEGDLGNPNVLVPLSEQTAHTKAQHIVEAFASQRDKHWFSAETFLSLARIRGLECGPRQKFAEGFYGRKITL